MSDNKDDKEKKPSFTFGPFEQALAVLVVMGFGGSMPHFTFPFRILPSLIAIPRPDPLQGAMRLTLIATPASCQPIDPLRHL
jgi:hypothetical protein